MVRLRSSGSFPRVDLSIVDELVEAAIGEWDALRFRGPLVNQHTDSLMESVVLVSGRHRQPGARYRATVEFPVLGLPDDRLDEFAKRSEAIRSGDRAARDSYHADRAAAMVQIGTRTEVLDGHLRADDAREISVTLERANAGSADVRVQRSSAAAQFSTDVDLSALIRSQGKGAVLRWLLGGRADVEGVTALSPLFDNGTGVVGSLKGTINRFNVDGDVRVATEGNAWRISIDATVKGKGLGRLATGVGGRLLRRQMTKELDRFWATADRASADLAGELTELRAEVDRLGGPRAFIRQLLYGPIDIEV